MKYLIKLAFRNLSRNRRRSLLAVTSVTIAILCVTFFRGFAGGMIKSVVKNSTKNETGHIITQQPTFLWNVPTDNDPLDHSGNIRFELQLATSLQCRQATLRLR